jgi:protein-disulfide isomerase
MSLRPSISDKDHVQGNENAFIELVEYGDFQCPYCGSAYPIVKRIQEILGDKLKFIFRNFPLKNVHPQAMSTAIAAEAASLQENYWPMHDIIFENQKRLNWTSLLKYARDIELDLDQFVDDIERPSLQKKVEADLESGLRSGVNATPTFFINGEKYNRNWEGGYLLDYIMANYSGVIDHGDRD